MKANLLLSLFKLTFCLFFVLLSFNVSAQQIEVSSLPMGGDWKELIRKNGVSFEFKRLECHNNATGMHYERVLVRVTNDNPVTTQVSWDRKHWYNLDECHNCGSNRAENHNELVLTSGQVLYSTCDREVLELCVTTARLDGKARPLLAFEFQNLTVISD